MHVEDDQSTYLDSVHTIVFSQFVLCSKCGEILLEGKITWSKREAFEGELGSGPSQKSRPGPRVRAEKLGPALKCGLKIPALTRPAATLPPPL